MEAFHKCIQRTPSNQPLPRPPPQLLLPEGNAAPPVVSLSSYGSRLTKETMHGRHK